MNTDLEVKNGVSSPSVSGDFSLLDVNQKIVLT